MDAYRDWQDECSAVSGAYCSWADASEADAATAWQAYEAALDREDRASSIYSELIQQVR
jgi:hypothetical protein